MLHNNLFFQKNFLIVKNDFHFLNFFIYKLLNGLLINTHIKSIFVFEKLILESSVIVFFKKNTIIFYFLPLIIFILEILII